MDSLISSLPCAPVVDTCHPELVHPLSVLSEPYAEHLVYTERASVSDVCFLVSRAESCLAATDPVATISGG
jgi:hypothetical protein